MTKIIINGVARDMNAQEQADYDARQTEWSNTSAERKLAQIKNLRLQRLNDTDYMANSDYVMEEKYKTWRQSLRDLPQNNTTESEYDTLLAQDDAGKLTHSIWEKP
tara:strand:+ start:793 stop:1110 length:318 start_codon:yes stop_codon:yes gene_type:complete